MFLRLRMYSYFVPSSTRHLVTMSEVQLLDADGNDEETTDLRILIDQKHIKHPTGTQASMRNAWYIRLDLASPATRSMELRSHIF